MGVFAYGAAVYVLFVGTFLYAIGFVENLLVGKSIDSGIAGSTYAAVIVNVALLSLFGVQHTIMARPAFKRWFARHIPKAAERSTFVLATCICLILTFRFWRPIEGALWSVDNEIGRMLLYGVSFFGWALVLYATFCIDHFGLFGLRQVWAHLRGQEFDRGRFVTPWLYKLVRNPLMLGFIIAFWATPDMTFSHLLFAAVTTSYIFFGVFLEERDLSAQLGEDYRRYRARTPMLLPWPRKRVTSAFEPQRVPVEISRSSLSLKVNV
ncbi:MAG: isoprenylcysteine carboxylmethyltransferase family protein [Phycisphaerales bacterium]|nr:isoprenylcysteine carboxylmethyltransferase family protein [Phycisphaerales bacterium]MCB9857307.1 isoprenylcysteine carboxylmethyltransferase family protein [Phycisphaerales bacterium]MCB9862979.1 isoprenylcysteine carboxylmethyltransferase family protein [Phycisphaerales bacterium]